MIYNYRLLELREILSWWKQFTFLGLTFLEIKKECISYERWKHVKLADLGISRNLKDKTASLRSTFCGTLLYMSPEMSQHKDYSFNTDVWYLEMIDFFWVDFYFLKYFKIKKGQLAA